jgi:Domain of unknown function (DUF2017)
MNGWRRAGRGDRLRLVCRLAPHEANLLRSLAGEVRTMLAARSGDAPQDELAALTNMRVGPSDPPTDRVLARLLPDFSRDDADLSAALRSLREPELIEAKEDAASLLLDTCPPAGGKVELTVGQADAWLAALNDIRLALGTILDVTEDTPDDLPPGDPHAQHLGVYHWLTFVQDSLVQARMAAL